MKLKIASLLLLPGAIYALHWKGGLRYLVISLGIEHCIIFTALTSLIYQLNSNLPSFVASYLLALMLLINLYEIQYLINDVIAIRWEDKPTYREYVKEVKGFVFQLVVVSRLAYVTVLYNLLSSFGISSIKIIIAILTLGFTFLLHNIQRIHLYRIMTYTLIRFSRYIFIPLILLTDSAYLYHLIIVLLPMLIVDVVTANHYTLSKYGIKYELNLPPLYYLFTLFLPIQIALIYPRIALLCGNIIVIVVSLCKNILIDIVKTKRTKLQS